MLSVEEGYERGLFKHLCNGAFHSVKLRIYIGYESHLFFSKCLKFDVHFGN